MKRLLTYQQELSFLAEMIDLPCLIYTPCSVPIMSYGINVHDSWQGGVRVCGHGPEQSLPTHSEPGPMTRVSLAPCSKQLSCHKNQQWLRPFCLQVKQIRSVWQPIVQAATRELTKNTEEPIVRRNYRGLEVLVYKNSPTTCKANMHLEGEWDYIFNVSGSQPTTKDKRRKVFLQLPKWYLS